MIILKQLSDNKGYARSTHLFVCYCLHWEIGFGCRLFCMFLIYLKLLFMVYVSGMVVLLKLSRVVILVSRENCRQEGIINQARCWNSLIITVCFLHVCSVISLSHSAVMFCYSSQAYPNESSVKALWCNYGVCLKFEQNWRLTNSSTGQLYAQKNRTILILTWCQ